MKKIKSYIVVTALMLIYIALVFFCCLHNFSSGPELDLGKYFLGIRLDRYIHFTMFFPYPFVAWLFLNYNNKFNIYRHYTYAIILISGLFFATLAETSQEMLTLYRDTDPFDFVANLTGISVGTLLVHIFNKPIKKISDWGLLNKMP